MKTDQIIKKLEKKAIDEAQLYADGRDRATELYKAYLQGANLLSPDLAQALELLEEVTKRYGIEWPDIETLLSKYKSE